MRGLILFDDLFDVDEALQARATEWADDLRAFDKIPTEVLTLPWSAKGDMAGQLFGIGLLSFDRYTEVCVMQPQGLCIQAAKVFLLEQRKDAGFNRTPVRDGEPQKADAIMDVAT